uniref:Uncharacterized protein LOC8280587 isoform X1 n=1 Tax=Rhizophora mucronata TaxID=61149 RepID=A0A2P2K682_RHIMU
MSGPDVTITLGRTGQVVTRGGKHARGERFDGSDDSLLFSANKRNRGDGIKWSPGLDGPNGSKMARNDLRLKLMRKRLSKHVQNAVEEHEMQGQHNKLSKSIQPAASSHMLAQSSKTNRSNIPREITNDMRHDNSLGMIYTSQSMGGSRARSPDRTWKSSSGFLPPRIYGEVHQVPVMRAADIPRSGHFFSNEVPNAPRPTSSASIVMKPTSQSASLVTRAPPPSGIVKNVSYMGEEPLTVGGFLHSLGLGKYAVSFQAEEVDMTVLKQMGDKDLKEMGIPMGPRKKILLALLPYQKRQTSGLQR